MAVASACVAAGCGEAASPLPAAGVPITVPNGFTVEVGAAGLALPTSVAFPHPFPGSYAYAYGFRNAFDLAFDDQGACLPRITDRIGTAS